MVFFICNLVSTILFIHAYKIFINCHISFHLQNINSNIKLLRFSRWSQQSIKLIVVPFWVWHSLQLHKLQAWETSSSPFTLYRGWSVWWLESNRSDGKSFPWSGYKDTMARPLLLSLHLLQEKPASIPEDIQAALWRDLHNEKWGFQQARTWRL